LSGAKGTTLNVELSDPKPGQIVAVRGIARDNKGNVFTLTF
jgi:hypothetical protein